MKSTLLGFLLATASASACLAQTWETGVVGGYGWNNGVSITTPTDSARAGFPNRAAVGVVIGENLYNYVGGEIRWLYQFGGPQLGSNGITESALGYTNTVTYDFLFHMTPKESKLRPFVAAGAGIKVYTGSFRDVAQPLAGVAVLRPITEAEPAIDAGLGLKYLLPKHVQIRLDFRVSMAPLPDRVIRPTGPQARIHGWLYDFLPLAGVSYVF